MGHFTSRRHDAAGHCLESWVLRDTEVLARQSGGDRLSVVAPLDIVVLGHEVVVGHFAGFGAGKYGLARFEVEGSWAVWRVDLIPLADDIKHFGGISKRLENAGKIFSTYFV